VVQSDGHNVLRVTVADDVTCTPREGSLHLEMRNHTLEIWLVPDAKTVDEAAERVPQQIMTEFKDFKATGTTHLTIADAPAQRLMGFGIEADDGDPGNADVIVFKVGDNIFMACVHGESLPPSAQQWMLTVVQTAR
jgi:hypothetical protein